MWKFSNCIFYIWISLGYHFFSRIHFPVFLFPILESLLDSPGHLVFKFQNRKFKKKAKKKKVN